MGALVVCGLFVALLALAIFVQQRIHQGVDLVERRRHRENMRLRQIWRNAGGLSYPHTLADGRVRWYHVDHDPVEL